MYLGIQIQEQQDYNLYKQQNKNYRDLKILVNYLNFCQKNGN